MPRRLTVEVYTRLDPPEPGGWMGLIPSATDESLIRLKAEAVGAPVSGFHTIVAREDGKPVFLVPLYETTMIPRLPHGKTIWSRLLSRVVSALTGSRALVAGFCEGGYVGEDHLADAQVLDQARRLSLDTLKVMADAMKVRLLDFAELTTGRVRYYRVRNVAHWFSVRSHR